MLDDDEAGSREKKAEGCSGIKRTPEDVAEDALSLAPENGHLEVLRFMKDEWHVTGEDALGLAAENGHLEVPRIQKDEWGIDRS